MSFPQPFYRWRPHPWHGLEVGSDPPGLVHAYIEITPFDLVKYELDKVTGYLRVDRPARTSSLPPTLYGFIPRTYCGTGVGDLRGEKISGDKDPLDICVVTERPINRAEVIVNARVIGGLPMLDHGEADDKIIAVLSNDNLWSDVADVSELPAAYVDRLIHYFGTYKNLPGEETLVEVGEVYGREFAESVVKASIADYDAEFGG